MKNYLKKSNLILILLGLILVILSRKYILIVTLFFIGSISKIYLKYISLPLGFELYTLSTVIISINYGPKIGILFGLITTLMALLISGKIHAGSYAFLVSSSVVGFSAFYLINTFDLSTTGIILTIIYNTILGILTYFTGIAPTSILTYVITNFIFNFIIFSSIINLFRF